MAYRKRGSYAQGVHTSHIGYLAHRNRKREARRKRRHQNNSKIIVRNVKERNVGTKRKSYKQYLTSAEDLTNN